jgi:hypothetical protein
MTPPAKINTQALAHVEPEWTSVPTFASLIVSPSLNPS